MIYKYFVLFLILFNIAGMSNDKQFHYTLKQDLVIGNSDDDNYFMGNVYDIDIDQLGNIYVLDENCKNILVFNASGRFLHHIGREGQGPGEFSNFAALDIACSAQGDVYIMDSIVPHISRFSTTGEYLDSFRIPFNFMRNFFMSIDLQGNLIVIGLLPNSDKMFHLFSNKGVLKKSFGTLFPVPREADRSFFNEGRDLLRLPTITIDDKTGDVLALSSMEYKIWRFPGQSDSPKLFAQRQADYFKPYQYIILNGKKLRIRSFKTINHHQELFFLSFQPDTEIEEYKLDVFLGCSYLGTINVKGHLLDIDRSGKLYFAEENRIARYRLDKSK